MKGDFSRDTFDLTKNFSRVLMQQGRVQLDADWNEQTAILLNYLQTLASDLIGAHGGPGEGFKIDFLKNAKGETEKDGSGNPKDLTIAPGHYYVDGILCVNGEKFNGSSVSYFNQPHYQASGKFPEFPFLVYLDVWERHITCVEDDSLCEVALGGIDTSTRAQIVWQVKLQKLPPDLERTDCDSLAPPRRSNALLAVRALTAQDSEDPCIIEPDARYRGAENQLYRVEVHTGNADEFGNVSDDSPTPTFKWSRENGSVIFPVINVTVSKDATEVTLANLGRDDKFTLNEGDWVELVDDAYTLQNQAGKLLRISAIDRDESIVTLDGAPTFSNVFKPENHPLLRRWDQNPGKSNEDGSNLIKADNALEILEGKGDDNWLTLEDGIQIQFQRNAELQTAESITRDTAAPPRSAAKSIYRTGDYWLIPARTATGDVIWEKDAQNNPIPQPPRGIEHHQAPLGIISDTDSLTVCRRSFPPAERVAQPKEKAKTKDRNQ